MKKIIPPVDVAILKSQLKQEYFLRTTNHGNIQIYVVDNTNAPDVLREIGRLREEAFRAGGGGTGQELDLDRFDTDPAYTPDTEVIKDGYFHESEFRSAPYFDLRIDGITLLNEKF